MKILVLALTAAACIAASERGSLPHEGGWPSFGYDLDNTRHVPYEQINTATVHALELAWKYRTGVYGPFETSPIVVGRTMFITSAQITRSSPWMPRRERRGGDTRPRCQPRGCAVASSIGASQFPPGWYFI